MMKHDFEKQKEFLNKIIFNCHKIIDYQGSVSNAPLFSIKSFVKNEVLPVLNSMKFDFADLFNDDFVKSMDYLGSAAHGYGRLWFRYNYMPQDESRKGDLDADFLPLFREVQFGLVTFKVWLKHGKDFTYWIEFFEKKKIMENRRDDKMYNYS